MLGIVDTLLRVPAVVVAQEASVYDVPRLLLPPALTCARLQCRMIRKVTIMAVTMPSAKATPMIRLNQLAAEANGGDRVS